MPISKCPAVSCLAFNLYKAVGDQYLPENHSTNPMSWKSPGNPEQFVHNPRSFCRCLYRENCPATVVYEGLWAALDIAILLGGAKELWLNQLGSSLADSAIVRESP